MPCILLPHNRRFIKGTNNDIDGRVLSAKFACTVGAAPWQWGDPLAPQCRARRRGSRCACCVLACDVTCVRACRYPLISHLSPTILSDYNIYNVSTVLYLTVDTFYITVYYILLFSKFIVMTK